LAPHPRCGDGAGDDVTLDAASNVVRYGQRCHEDRSYDHDTLTDEHRSHDGRHRYDDCHTC
jgi:hypothetical protein